MKRIAALTTLLGSLFLFIPTAQAHTELISTSPSAESVVDAPTSIELNFSEAPLLEGSAIVIHDQAGAELVTKDLSLDGSTLSIPWPEDAQPGKLVVSWRAVADDGHVNTGEFSFEYSGAAIFQTVATPLAAEPRMETPVAKEADTPKKLNVVWLGIGLVLLLGAFAIAAFSSRRQ